MIKFTNTNIERNDPYYDNAVRTMTDKAETAFFDHRVYNAVRDFLVLFSDKDEMLSYIARILYEHLGATEEFWDLIGAICTAFKVSEDNSDKIYRSLANINRHAEEKNG